MCAPNSDIAPANSVADDTLRAQIRNAPAVYQSNATYSPLYTQLGLQNLESFMNGPKGFLAQYQNQMMPALVGAQNDANAQTRTATLSDAARLTPQFIANRRAAAPGAAGLLDTLTSNTSRDLSYGTELTPEEKVQLRQSVRGGAAARGMGMGPDAVFDESMAQSGAGLQLYQQRTGQAQTLTQMLQNFYGDPTAMIAGTGSNAGMNAGGMSSVAAGSVAPTMLSMFNPESSYAQTALQTNQSGRNTAAGAAAQGFSSGMSAM